MCGLMAYSGDFKPNLAKLKIIGLINESRGRDSCGIYYNGSVTKGIGATKMFSDFIQAFIMKDEESPKGNVFIGHTRFGTGGAHTAENAHPFIIDQKNIFAHNGVIKNIDDLLIKYNIDKEKEELTVDSKGLGTLLSREGKKILEEYRGYAAILNHPIDEPDALWVFRGSSKEFEYPSSLPINERPLFYAVHQEGIYFSSLKEPLLMIRDGEGQEPIEFPVNKLIKIVGSTIGVEEYDIHRETCNIGINFEKKPTVTYPTTHIPTTFPITKNTNLSMGRTKVGAVIKQLPFEFSKPTEKIDILNETYPPKVYNITFTNSENDFVFYWKGRYWFGQDELCNGVMYLNKDGFIAAEASFGYYENYFYSGVLLEGKKAYDTIMFEIETKTSLGVKISNPHFNFAKHIAAFSKYPVSNLSSEFTSIPAGLNQDARVWFQKDERRKTGHEFKIANHSFTPLYAPDRNYVFKEGSLIKIYAKSKDDKTLVNLATSESKYVNVKMSHTLDTTGIQVNTLLGFFKRKFLSLDEFEAECPSTVKIALGFYIEDFLLITESNNPSEADVLDCLNNFVKVCIKDNISFEDNFQNLDGVCPIKTYIIAAIQYEQSDEEYLKKKNNFDVKELEIIQEENTQVRKGLSMAKTMINILKKKSKEFDKFKNPLGRLISKEFFSFGELLNEALNNNIDSVKDSNLLSDKADLKNILNK